MSNVVVSALPPLMRVICDAVGFLPANDNKASRRKLVQKVSEAEEEVWLSIPKEGQEWYNTAVRCLKKEEDIPGFVGSDVTKAEAKVQEVLTVVRLSEMGKSQAGTGQLAAVARLSLRNSKMRWKEFENFARGEGITMSIATLGASKAWAKRMLIILKELGMLTEEGQELLNDRIFAKGAAKGVAVKKEKPVRKPKAEKAEKPAPAKVEETPAEEAVAATPPASTQEGKASPAAKPKVASAGRFKRKETK